MSKINANYDVVRRYEFPCGRTRPFVVLQYYDNGNSGSEWPIITIARALQ
jgi:hypothetical protein